MKTSQKCSIPFITCHVAIYACSRATCFHNDMDYSHYLDTLKSFSKLHGIALHAYSLLCNHVHFVATPADKYALYCVVQDVNTSYEKYLQQEYRHDGGLWQENYHISMLQEGRYLLECYKYIEMNPVRIGLVDYPAGYSWSSYRFHGHGKTDPAITVHDSYIALGNSDRERQEAWRSFLARSPDAYDTYQLKRALFYSRPVGDEKFVAEVERAIEYNRRFAAETDAPSTAVHMQ